MPNSALSEETQVFRLRFKPGAKRALEYLADDYPEAAEVMETLA